MYLRILQFFYEHPEARIILSNKHGNVTIDIKIGNLLRKKFLEESNIEKESKKRQYFSTFVINGHAAMIEMWINGGMKESPAEMAEMVETFTVKI